MTRFLLYLIAVTTQYSFKSRKSATLANSYFYFTYTNECWSTVLLFQSNNCELTFYIHAWIGLAPGASKPNQILSLPTLKICTHSNWTFWRVAKERYCKILFSLHQNFCGPYIQAELYISLVFWFNSVWYHHFFFTHWYLGVLTLLNSKFSCT